MIAFLLGGYVCRANRVHAHVTRPFMQHMLLAKGVGAGYYEHQSTPDNGINDGIQRRPDPRSHARQGLRRPGDH